MASRKHLRSYDVYWYGPPRHESYKKAGGLNVLSRHITDAFRKAKITTAPLVHEVHIGFREAACEPEIYARHPKTNWLHWVLDFHILEALSLSATNNEIGEFSISIARDLMKVLKNNPNLVENYPFEVVERAIETFRSENYSYTSRLSPIRKFDASPLTARFQMFGSCLETVVTMIFFLGKEELHRREVISFNAGDFDTARYSGNFDLYDNEIKISSIDISRPVPIIKYSELPKAIQKHLPTNEQLHSEWGTLPNNGS